jgi:hypothetical protein
MTISFPVTAIEAVNDFNLTSKIPQPVMNGTPVGYFSAPQYTGTAEWKVTGGAAAGGLFAANTAYTGTVRLTAVSGWTFTGVAAAFTHAGASDVQVLYNTGDSITVIIGFPATGSVPAVPVTDLNLTDKVPRPVMGGTPSGWFSAPEYTGTAVWTATNGGAAVGGLFAANTAYTATVTLTAVSGYTFSGVGANAFTHSGASGVTNEAGKGTVTITFPATGIVPAVPVTDLNLTEKVPRPVMGGTPSGWFSAPQYTGTAVWTATNGGTAVDGLFAANTAYTAAVTLTAVSGYTFSGVGANAFTHSGALEATNAAGKGTVTIAFPTTPANGSGQPIEIDVGAKW